MNAVPPRPRLVAVTWPLYAELLLGKLHARATHRRVLARRLRAADPGPTTIS